MASVYLTRHGFTFLHNELRELIEVRRPQVMADLTLAREFGDIRENAEYEIAKRDQGVIEGRIHELEDLLASVQIIEVPSKIEEAILGARLLVENQETGHQTEYLLVSEQEAHLAEQYLSAESPLGQALLGSRVGDQVTFNAPAGVRRFKVLALFGANGGAE